MEEANECLARAKELYANDSVSFVRTRGMLLPGLNWFAVKKPICPISSHSQYILEEVQTSAVHFFLS